MNNKVLRTPPVIAITGCPFTESDVCSILFVVVADLRVLVVEDLTVLLLLCGILFVTVADFGGLCVKNLLIG